MAAGRHYLKKGTTPPQQGGYTGIFAGEDGLLRALQDDGSVSVIQSSGIVAGNGLETSGLATNVLGGTGITVGATVAVDFTAVAASGNYAPSGNYLTPGTGVPVSRTITAGAGMTGGGDLTTNRTLDVIGVSGITANVDSIQFDTVFGDIRYALSGVGLDAFAGSGLVAAGDVIHAQVGSGLYLQNDLFGVDFSQVQVSGDYVTQAEGDARYDISGAADTERAAHEAQFDHTSYEASGTADAKITTHVAESDPHTQYLTEVAAPSLYEASGRADAVRTSHEAASDHIPETRNLEAGSGLTGGGTLAADRAFHFDTAFGDGRYALSGAGGGGTGTPGSGLYQADSALHIAPGWGLEFGTGASGLQASQTQLDVRYALSGQGGGGGASLSGVSLHEEFSATSTYKFAHNLGAYPVVQVFDSGRCLLDVDWCYSGLNHVELSFLGTITGGYITAVVGGSGDGGGGGGSGDSLSITSSGLVHVSTTLLDQTIDAGELFWLSGISPEYDWLEIELVNVRANDTSGGYVALLEFNGDDNSSNYFHAGHNFGNVHQSYDSTGPWVGLIPDSDANANYTGFARARVYGYGVPDRYTQVHTIGGNANPDSSSAQTRQYDWIWENIESVTDFRLKVNSGDGLFMSGTQCVVRGVKSRWVVTSGTYGGLTIRDGMIAPVEGAGGGAATFSGLNDVSDGPWASGNFAVYNGTQWVPGSAGSSGSSPLTVTSGQVVTETVIGRIELTATSGGIDFTSIPQDYDHLKMRMTMRGENAGDNENLSIFFNGDTTNANYHHTRGYARNASTPVSEEGSAAGLPQIAAAGSPANKFSVVELEILNYGVSSHHTTYSHSYGMDETTDEQRAGWGVNTWDNSAAINRITLEGYSGDGFLSGCIVELLGIKREYIVKSVTGEGGVSSLTKTSGAWNPDNPPVSGTTWDDEFTDQSLDAKWLEWDPAAALTVTERADGLLLEKESTTDNTTQWAGIYQPAPSGTSWTAIAKVSLEGQDDNAVGIDTVGIGIAEDLLHNPTTADLNMLMMRLDVTASPNRRTIFGGAHYDDYTTFNSVGTRLADYGESPGGQTQVIHDMTMYLRLRKHGSTLNYDYSTDGLGWVNAWSGVAQPFAAQKLGLFLDGSENSTGHTARALVHWFRVLDTTYLAEDAITGRRDLLDIEGGVQGGAPSLTVHASGEVHSTPVLLHEQYITGGAVGFSGIVIPSGYDELEIEGHLRGSRTDDANGETVLMYINGDKTDGNYWGCNVQWGEFQTGTTDTDIEAPTAMAAASNGGSGNLEADSYAHNVTRVYGLQDTNKPIHWHTSWLNWAGSVAADNPIYAGNFQGRWEPASRTNPVSGLEFVGQTADTFVSGSYIRVWGIKREWIITSGTYGDLKISNGLLVP